MRLLLLALVALAGCEAPCVADLDSDCAPLYADLSWDNVHAQTIEPSCAGAGCHSADEPAGGLTLTPADTAWSQLVEPASGAAHVIAGDAACSPMIKRTEADDGTVMPPGAQLSAAERCALQLWVDQGASR